MCLKNNTYEAIQNALWGKGANDIIIWSIKSFYKCPWDSSIQGFFPRFYSKDANKFPFEDYPPFLHHGHVKNYVEKDPRVLLGWKWNVAIQAGQGEWVENANRGARCWLSTELTMAQVCVGSGLPWFITWQAEHQCTGRCSKWERAVDGTSKAETFAMERKGCEDCITNLNNNNNNNKNLHSISEVYLAR